MVVNADVRMPGRQGPAHEAASGPENDCVKEDSLADKLRGGDYAEMCSGLEAQALQLQPDGQIGTLSPGDAQALADKAAAAEARARPKAPMQAAADALAAAQQDAEKEADGELAVLRAARLRQLQNDRQMENHWVKQGHGVYRTIEDERAFFKDIEPHERTVCLLYRDEGDDLHDALALLAQKHLETMFYKLPEQRAHYMLEMLSLQGLPTLLCIRHGRVVEAVPPSQLRARPAARILARLGLIDDEEVRKARRAIDDRDEEEDSEDSEDDKPRRKGNGFFKQLGRSVFD